MVHRSCDGAGFLAAFRSAVASLEANVEEINALNVFPVPDGDTGTNMLATVRAALDEADRIGSDGDAERVAQAASFGALMGARGNSGVITSQILAGIASGLAGKRRFNGLDLAHALDAGTRKAYQAVAKPVEGTILTVIREASAAAVAAAERDNNVEAVLAATLEAAERSVARTPSLLPVLREAHVVDSGGQGLFRLFQGALEAARGRPLAGGADRTAAPSRSGSAATPAVDETAFGYETVFVLRPRPGELLDVPALQGHLEAIGESVLVAGDGHLAKIHIHNDRPDAVLAHGLRVGRLSRITIENLDSQAHDVREARAMAFVGGAAQSAGGLGAGAEGVAAPVTAAPVTAAPVTAAGAVAAEASGAAGTGFLRSAARCTHRPDESDLDAPLVPIGRLPLGVVAVAPSDGLASLLADTAAPFREYGAFRVVRGGQGANPSTGELLEAVVATQADALLILPNNPNVILAARQVAAMTDRPVHVVPTRNCAEGVAALFELDPAQDAETNAATMTQAGRAIQTLQVTAAVRDATVSGHKVRKGQTMVLDPDDGLLAVDNEPERAVLTAFARLEAGFAVVTIYYGDTATLDEAEGLAQRIHEANAGLEEVHVLHGGQPHYRYLISAE